MFITSEKNNIKFQNVTDLLFTNHINDDEWENGIYF